ncbi:MAG: S-methyl-5-thioribose-1-phosphate isomerase [Planctomycetota bacterium]|nr:MAG: S-methyl-5-thioribose-1-phosphate isomerase [Planctomycetota bacterium]
MNALTGVRWEARSDGGSLWLLDQTLLPETVREIDASCLDVLLEAITTLRVRGAPAIGIAAAYGLASHCLQASHTLDSGASGDDLFPALSHALHVLRESRPTAVNMFHCLDRMRDCFDSHSHALTARELAARLIMEARRIHSEDANLCQGIARHGADILPQHGGILTICNTGALATGGVGTALGCIAEQHRRGAAIEVLACETRPLLQGARLTALECQRAGIPVRLISDGMAGYCMAQGMVQAVIVGADRICANGDTANKIGTYQLAVLAHYHRIPFIVAAPSTTFDLACSSGDRIAIEQRHPDEVRAPRGHAFAPADVPVLNPAFDITPATLIQAIICERGMIAPVTAPSIAQLIDHSPSLSPL